MTARSQDVLVETDHGTITAKAVIVAVPARMIETGRLKIDDLAADISQAFADVPMGYYEKIAIAFDGKVFDELPANLDVFEKCRPVYEEMPGWQTAINGAKCFADLPVKAQNYVKRLEELMGCPIVLVSVGPRRDETIMLKNPFA